MTMLAQAYEKQKIKECLQFEPVCLSKKVTTALNRQVTGHVRLDI